MRLSKLLLELLFLTICLNGLAQPYGGTIFVDPDIILPSDSSTLVSVTYKERGSRTVFDRRLNAWTTVNAWLFEVVWNDGLMSEAVINPEFETIELAQVEAEKYGRVIGQLPTCLRTDVDQIWVHRGVQPFGGGNRSILVHTGQTELYEKDGILEETLVHEASHTSLDAIHAAAPGWLEAQDLDGGFISGYAEDFPDREDIAESFLLWLAVRHRPDRISTEDRDLITKAIPNRLNYFDDITCDLFPIVIDNTTPVKQPDEEAGRVVLYPNPATGFIRLRVYDGSNYQATIFNVVGEAVWYGQINSDQRIDLLDLPDGAYFLTMEEGGRLIRKKFVKN